MPIQFLQHSSGVAFCAGIKHLLIFVGFKSAVTVRICTSAFPLKGMSLEQLGNFTLEQANAVSSTQRQFLSSSQKAALQEASSLGVTQGASSGSRRHLCSK